MFSGKESVGMEDKHGRLSPVESSWNVLLDHQSYMG